MHSLSMFKSFFVVDIIISQKYKIIIISTTKINLNILKENATHACVFSVLQNCTA